MFSIHLIFDEYKKNILFIMNWRLIFKINKVQRWTRGLIVVRMIESVIDRWKLGFNHWVSFILIYSDSKVISPLGWRVTQRSLLMHIYNEDIAPPTSRHHIHRQEGSHSSATARQPDSTHSHRHPAAWKNRRGKQITNDWKIQTSKNNKIREKMVLINFCS